MDPWFFVEAAPDLTPLIHTARLVNDGQPEFVLKTIQKALGELNGKRIAALGLAFKPNVDDLRESPAIEVAHLLVQSGALVSAYEPYKPDFPVKGVTMTHSLESAIQDAELIVLLVGHDQFKQLTPVEVAKLTTARVVLDTVNGWNSQAWKDAGFKVIKLGKGEK